MIAEVRACQSKRVTDTFLKMNFLFRGAWIALTL